MVKKNVMSYRKIISLCHCLNENLGKVQELLFTSNMNCYSPGTLGKNNVVATK